MINSRDVVLGLYVAWRLLLFDGAARQYIDATIASYWKSFYAAAIALPAVFIVRLLYLDAHPELTAHADTERIVAVFALDYVYQWVAFPLLMVYGADAIGRSRQYVAFIVAHNWAQVVQVAIILPAFAIFAAAGPEPSGTAAALLFAAHLVTWIYSWFIARTVLEIGGGIAALVVLGELAVSYTIAWGSESLIAAG